MYKRIVAMCLILALASGCFFSLSKMLFRAGTTAIQVESVEVTDSVNSDWLDRVDENYPTK